MNGTKFDKASNILCFDDTKEVSDRSLNHEAVTMNVICDIANSIDSDIVMTADTPLSNVSGKLPCLDL